jgi:ribose-phosphate pyrophosphokinase
MSAGLHYFAANEAEAERLASALGISSHPVAVHQFPDGESLVRVTSGASLALLFCSLDQPDSKLVQVLLAASALREGGADRVVLVAPYLCYMRQDQAFAPGEAVSQRVIGNLISAHFDGLVTVDAHLHRTSTLNAVVPGIIAVNVSAAASLAQAIAGEVTPDTILAGPDEESRPWVEAVAAQLGLEVNIGKKVRRGDRAVEIEFSGITIAARRPVVLVDDLVSSGGTLIDCARQFFAAGATRVAAMATHCLASRSDLGAIAAAGIVSLRATDTVPGPVATISIAPAVAQAIRASSLV